MTECLFCQIITGKIPSYKIYEDEKYYAFLDIFPFGPGHTLVIPKAHYTWVWDYPDLGEYMEVARKIAMHLKSRLATQAIYVNIFGNEVPHAHIHLIPATDRADTSLSKAFASLRSQKITDEDAKILLNKLK